ncbi:MAG: response regulator [Phycisphaerae bacterium]|nr:response regulator [Phycisphaerae bacterium]
MGIKNHQPAVAGQLGCIADVDGPPASQDLGATGGRIRVLCVDDAIDLADLLTRIVRAEPDLETVGALYSAQNLVDEALLCRAEVVVLDLTMPGPSPMIAIRDISTQIPRCRVIAYSGYDDAETERASLRAGAFAMVSKHGGSASILRAIRKAGSAARA